MRTQLAKGNIPVLGHHARAIQVPQALVRVGLQAKLCLSSVYDISNQAAWIQQCDLTAIRMLPLYVYIRSSVYLTRRV